MTMDFPNFLNFKRIPFEDGLNCLYHPLSITVFVDLAIGTKIPCQVIPTRELDSPGKSETKYVSKQGKQGK